ncbi:UNVERIFIED_CONTAM: translocon subunit [Siphonaria sp. JEL0065]|nr:translocon subunit [Siphonaria sp. JEL0065]
MSGSSLKAWKPLISLLPEVKSPSYKVPFAEKVSWTLGVGLAYLVGSQLPLFLAEPSTTDALYWLRPAVGGNKGTLLDFGVSSIIVSGFSLQLLVASGHLNVDFAAREQRALFGGLQKLVAVGVVIAQALIAVLCGVYGTNLTPFATSMLLTQLIVAGVLAILLDEVLQKGYGFGTGHGLFIGAHTTENLIWKTFSFRTFQTGRGTEYEGALVALVQLFISRKDKFRALKEAFYRGNLPNVFGLIVQVAALAIILYFQSTRYELGVQHSLQRQNVGKYPVKLLYNGAIPLIIVSTAVGLYTFVSQALFNLFPENLLVRVLGVWKSYDKVPQRFASSGLAYYLSPARNTVSAFKDPFQLVIYASLVIGTTIYLSTLWPEAAGNNAKDVAKGLEVQGLVLPGRREGSIYKELKALIPRVSATGGAIIAVVAVVADVFGPNGSGTAAVILVPSLYQFFEIIAVQVQNLPPGEPLY